MLEYTFGALTESEAVMILEEGLENFVEAEGRCPPRVIDGRDLQWDWIHEVDPEFSPAGKHCAQWSSDDVARFNEAATTILRRVRAAKGWTSAEMDAQNAWPNVPDKISNLITETRNLLALYKSIFREPVAIEPTLITEPKKRERNWPAIVGATALGLAIVGSVVYVARR